MKKIFKFIMFPALLVSTMQFSSCTGKLHIHDLEWKYNEEGHWQECKVCHKKIGEAEHSMNDFTDRCFICDYHDPIIKTDDTASVVGLTKHGKKKQTIDLGENILAIGPRAFSNSECTKIRIGEYFIGFEETAFEDSKVEQIVDPEEKEYVEWHYVKPYWVREDKILEYECMVRDGVSTKFYSTFKEAVENAEKNDTTITLLRDHIDLKSTDEIDVKHTITLEPLFTDGCTINDNGAKFYIHPAGYLRVPSTITYKAPTYLMLEETNEKRGDKGEETVLTSGSLIYSGYEDEPSSGKLPSVVNYCDRNKTELENYKCRISKQATGSGLSKTPHYAYGIVKFKIEGTGENTRYYIKGLTDFGQTCTELTISSPIEYFDDFEIANSAFTIKTRITIPIPILPDPHITIFKQKGEYSDLTIGKGIKSIGREAFANYIGSEIEIETALQIAYLLCPIISVTISDDVKYIDNWAFAKCLTIDSVTIGRNPTNSQFEWIGEGAFSENYLLKNVNLANCKNLKKIDKKVFNACPELHSVTLPTGKGWKTDQGHSYFPQDMTPENTAIFLRSTYRDRVWTREIDPTKIKFAWSKRNETDALGRPNKVHYVGSFPNEDEYGDDGTVYVFKEAMGKETSVTLWSGNKIINNNVNIIAEDDVIANFTGTLTINTNKWIRVSKNITPAADSGTTIRIGLTNGGDNYLNSGGFAQEVNDYISTSINGTHLYTTDIKGSGSISRQPMTSHCVINGKHYAAMGLFNFELKINAQNETYSKILSSSNLGKLCSEIIAYSPVLPSSESPVNECEINSFAFKHNNQLEKIEFTNTIKKINESSFGECNGLKQVIIGDAIKEIGDYSFRGCGVLWNVVFNNNAVLNKIGKEAFKNCQKLREVDFSTSSSTITSGWKAGDTTIDSSDLMNHIKAAELLSKTHCDVVWNRT